MGEQTTCNMAKSLPIIGLLFVAALALAAPTPTQNIVEVAAGIPDLSTLVNARKAGKLVTALSGAGPFTVFRPPWCDRWCPSLAKPCLDGTHYAHYTCFAKLDGTCPNGTCYSPPPAKIDTIFETAAKTVDLSTLVTALKAGKLVTLLDGTKKNYFFTVFAPTNEAFAALPTATLASLLEPANIKQLQSVLEYHVVAGYVYTVDLKASQDVTTLQGQKLHIAKVGCLGKRGGSVTVQKAKVIKADVVCANGYVQVINGVLVPPSTLGSAGKNMLKEVEPLAPTEKCCTDCVAPQVKYFSVDVPHGFCGETCIRPRSYGLFHLFEKNLTRAADNNPCKEQFTPNGGHYTKYTSTVSHGGFGLKVTLDLYGPAPEGSQPTGSYESSCSACKWADDTLTCDCQNGEGDLHKSTLPHYSACLAKGDDIDNVDGSLICNKKG